MGNRSEQTGKTLRVITWVVRVCFLAVFVVNVQCALSFILFPEGHMGAYEMHGVPGRAALQGLGVAFLMWNATYPAFIVNPRRFMALGAVILAQQAIGLVGESIICAQMPVFEGVNPLVATLLVMVGSPSPDSVATPLFGSILQFIAFDRFGLVIMAVSFALLLLQLRRSRAGRL